LSYLHPNGDPKPALYVLADAIRSTRFTSSSKPMTSPALKEVGQRGVSASIYILLVVLALAIGVGTFAIGRWSR
jgi:hypothetical protein